MSFTAGVYTLPAGNPVVTATPITISWANTTLTDIATALSTCMLKDGSQTATASVAFAQGLTAGGAFAIDASGNVAVTTNKFIITAASGNTAVGGIFTVSTVAQHGIGGNGIATIQLRLTGSFSGDRILSTDSTLTPGAGNSGFGNVIGPTVVEAGSGTHAIMSAMYVAPTATLNAGSTKTNWAALYVDTYGVGPSTATASGIYVKTPTGATTNFAITVATGLVNILTGGSTTISTGVGSVKMSTANAATNAAWIPIAYAGTTYYLPAWTTNSP